ncbi:hypothetical protein K438DRAFT_1992309 [Mycena galopus ATCC 62051]|nr:hypothetical protein K438DRAFT_1992309 [Mycena galopus ATCC 62051]
MIILIDDDNPLVQYSSPGGWNKSGLAPEFNTTTHTSATSGDMATLAFLGTSISVYGTRATNIGSRLIFSVDGVDLDSIEAILAPDTLHNQLFWTSPTFNETKHQLVITVAEDQDTPGATLNPSFFLDYFVYTTTATARQSVLFDDSDASVIYSLGGWQPNTTSQDCLEGTQHVSTSVGSWVALSFNGTGISLVGSPSQTGFTASIVLDGSVMSQSLTQTQQLFSTSLLRSGPHTINITVLDGSPLGIDYFLVQDDLKIPNVSLTSSPASGSTRTAAPGTPQSSKPPIAAVVGGAMGGLVVLVLALTFILIRRRRARARRNDDSSAVSAMPRCNTNGHWITAPHPFPLSRSNGTANPSPPPYTLKYRSVI